MAHILGTSVDYLTGKTDDPSPTNYIISQNKESELFSLIEAYNNSDSHTKTRLLDYFSKYITQKYL